MSIFGLFVFFFVLVPTVTPFAVVTALELTSQVLELSKSLLELWDIVNDTNDLVETRQSRKEKMLFDRIDNINVQISDIDEKLTGIDQHLNTVVRLLENLPQAIRLDMNLNDIRTRQSFIEIYYKKLEKFAMNFEKYENRTLVDFSNTVVSSSLNSVPSLMKAIFHQVTSRDFLKLFLQNFTPQSGTFFCNEQQSAQQVFHSFLTEMILTNTKSYILEQTAHAMKKLYGQGNFTKEVQDAEEEFIERTNAMISIMTTYMENASSELWRCDPSRHVRGETYVEITNFLHGLILNKANLDPNGKCKEECDVYSYTKTRKCNDNYWCKTQTTCPKIVNCQYVDSSMNVCTNRMARDNRRYEYVEFGNGRVFGKKKGCSTSYLETYREWLIYRCSYCFCLCDEGPKFFSDRYISLRAVTANVGENRVVTGLRFVKHNKIIHLQVQEGKLLPQGQIDLDTVRWVPVEDYRITDRYIYDGQDYHTISWEQRAFELNNIKAYDGSVVTGVRFRKVGTRVDLEIMTTPFNFTSGELRNGGAFSVFQDDPNLALKHKFPQELKLFQPDIPTRSTWPFSDHTTDKYVKFINTDYEKDAGQTTVPFFDAQPVVSAVPVPLAGVGIFHKGRSGFGGFIAPKIFTYEFTKHLRPLRLDKHKN